MLIIYAVTHNALHDVPVELVSEFQDEMFTYISESYPDITESIRTTKVLSPEIEEQLKEALSAFVKKFMADK